MNTITCKLMGGLGNQLFQIFTVMNYAFKHGCEFIFTSDKTLHIGRERNTYWDSFLSELEQHTSNRSINRIYKEPRFEYTEIPDIDGDVCLLGYFQSYKYFEEYCRDILDYLGIEISDSSGISGVGDVAMHFRIDDYSKLEGSHPVLPLEYYSKALSFICSKERVKNVTVIYQPCDRALVQERVALLQQEFTGLTFTMVDEEMSDWQQLLYMSRHKHKIIANSTFSWWAAYLNQSGTICYPETWFGKDLNHNTQDLFPSGWTKIQLKEK